MGEINDLKKSLDCANNTNELVTKIEELSNGHFEHIDMLDKKTSVLEDRNRRNNVRFGNVAESENETWAEKWAESKIRNLRSTDLGITTDVTIKRAHRTGKKEAGKKKQNNCRKNFKLHRQGERFAILLSKQIMGR